MPARIKMVGLEIEIDDGRNATKLIAESLQLLVNVASGASVSVNATQQQLTAPAAAPALPPPTQATTHTPVERVKRKYAKREATPQQKRAVSNLVKTTAAIKPPVMRGDPAAAKVSRRLVICAERPGKPMTLDEAAALAGVRSVSISQGCAPSNAGKKVGGYTFRWADKSPATTGNRVRASDTDAQPLLSRQQREDKALGLICGQCGFEPEHHDRSQKCVKCNSQRWDHKPQPPLQIPA